MTKTMLTASDGMIQSLPLPAIDLKNPGFAVAMVCCFSPARY